MVDHLGLLLQVGELKVACTGPESLKLEACHVMVMAEYKKCVPGSPVHGSLVLDNNRSGLVSVSPTEYFQLNSCFINLMWICSWRPHNLVRLLE